MRKPLTVKRWTQFLKNRKPSSQRGEPPGKRRTMQEEPDKKNGKALGKCPQTGWSKVAENNHQPRLTSSILCGFMAAWPST